MVYIHMQAYAALYQWHPEYVLHPKPFTKVPGTKVLDTIRQFARDHGLERKTLFRSQVANIKRNNDKRCQPL